MLEGSVPTNFLLFAVTAGGVASIAGAMWYFNADNVTKRAIRAAPVTPLVKAAPGDYIRVTGTIRLGGDTLSAPLSGRRCVWYGLYVDEYRSSGRSGRWVQVICEEKGQDYYIDDGTAVALVRGRTARVASPRDFTTRSGTFDDATEVERALLARYGRSDTNMIGLNRAVRYREAAFEPGEQVSVLGVVRALEDRVARCQLVSPQDGALLMSDDPSTLG